MKCLGTCLVTGVHGTVRYTVLKLEFGNWGYQLCDAINDFCTSTHELGGSWGMVPLKN